ncbi:MAG: class I SAM-dependent methyltransferase, partial [Polyangiaceae bacterium]|nr:class I SAM-dependent methyltransferase [Polyangiaceae bacterium]
TVDAGLWSRRSTWPHQASAWLVGLGRSPARGTAVMKEAVYHQYAATLSAQHWWVEHRRAVFRRWLGQLGCVADGSRRVLEIGSGVGTEFEFFNAFGPVTGVELNPVGAGYCGQRGYAELICADLNDVDLPEGVFDVAADFHVLYHQWVRDPACVLRRLHDSLKPGGYLLLTEPAFEVLRRAHDDVVMAARRWNRHDLRRLVEASGFVIERWSALLTLVAPGALFGALFDRFRRPHEDIRELEPGAPWLTLLIRAVMAVERTLIRWFPLPLGTCWALVARRGDPVPELPPGR